MVKCRPYAWVLRCSMSTESRVGTGVAAASYWSFRHRPIAASATRRSRPEFTLLWEGSGTTRRRIQSSIRLAVVARWRIGRLQRLHLPFLNACPLGRVPDRTSPPHKLRGVAHVGDKARGLKSSIGQPPPHASAKETPNRGSRLGALGQRECGNSDKESTARFLGALPFVTIGIPVVRSLHFR